MGLQGEKGYVHVIEGARESAAAADEARGKLTRAMAEAVNSPV
jgi:hypothetical protein